MNLNSVIEPLDRPAALRHVRGMAETTSKLRFIHLSDIHFSNRAAHVGFDPDEYIRNELRLDVEKQMEKIGAVADAILVSGDIAFAGKKNEYESAAAWLDEICDASGCERDAVYVCPGNHDIDQQVIRDNFMIADGQEAIRRGAALYEREKALMDRLVQPVARDLFYAPLREYNEFAVRYGCSFYGDKENFALDRDFPLNDGSLLRLRAMNSALLSGLQDSEQSLFLGQRAWTMPQATNVTFMTMAHHPPSWLLDRREIEAALNGRAKIQLFGHEHDQRVLMGRDWAKLFAGSVNPHRAEPNWRPGYNIVEIHVETGSPRMMVVDVHAREWQGEPPQFRAHEDVDNAQVHHNRIELPPLKALPRPIVVEPQAGMIMTDGASPTATGANVPPLKMRSIMNRFFRLSLSQKNEIIGRLELADEADKGLPDFERFKLALYRAKEATLLGEVDRMISRREGKA